jgi:hypothetical protein
MPPDPNPKHVEAIAFLLENGYGLQQYGELIAHQTDSTNLINDVHHGFLVLYDEESLFNGNSKNMQEWAFKTAQEAAIFYVNYINEHKLI